MKELIVHVGPHKTGTTSIQAAIYADAARLSAAGCYVPLSGTWDGVGGHHAFARDLDAADTVDQAGADLYAELLGVTAPKVLISSEGLSGITRDPRKYQRLRDLAGSLGRRLVIVAFVRDYLTLLNSFYVHEVRGFLHAKPFDFWIKEALVRPDLYTRTLAPFLRVADQLILLPFSGDVVDGFYRALDLPPPLPCQRLNEGSGPKIVELCRVMFRHYIRVFRLKTFPLSVNKRLIWREGGRAFGVEPAYWAFGPALGRQVAKRFLAADAGFFGEVGFQVPGSPRNRDVNDCQYDGLPEEDRAVFRSLLGDLVCATRAAPLVVRRSAPSLLPAQ